MPDITKTKSKYPVKVSDAKTHLRLDEDDIDDDSYLKSVIKAATRQAENYIGKDIALTSSVAKFWGFSGDTIRLDEGNLISIDSVISDTSTALTVGTTRKHDGYAEILLTTSVTYSTDYTPLTVNYTTGYATTSDVPEDIKQSILIKIANSYDVNREDDTPSFLRNSYASNNLLDSYKQIIWRS